MRFCVTEFSALAVIVAMLGSTVGCGGSNGPPRAEVSGYVTFQGQPVPVGTIEYRPNAEKGTSGPQVTLVIQDGYYDSDGKGPVFGHHTVKVSGYTGVEVPFIPEGERLFPVHKDDVEIVEESYTINYDFPLSNEG
ncbi:hypothetical protein [Rosistilla oblonga]|uniref:hypothetical protein n=1 Tax=Rosistilla oblonga TaxID=2527990 RepID=UPI003A9704E2